MVVSTATRRPVPWWIRSKAPWTGEIFNRMILRAEDPEEVRIQTIREATLRRYQDGKRRLSMAKALVITRSYQESEGLHPALRRAVALERVFREIPIALAPGQLLLGSGSSGPQVIDFNPEFLRIGVRQLEDGPRLEPMVADMETLYVFSMEDRQAFTEEVWPYWKLRARPVYFAHEMKRHYPEAWFYLLNGDSYDPPILGAHYHTIQDYATFLARGLLAIKEEIRAHMAELDAADPHTMDPFERRNQYAAMLLVADGIMAYASRNADLAEKLAAEEKDPERAAELREMARIARKVPAHPAETWWEAVQAFHFLRACTPLAEDGDSHSAGRFDQYMYPYLQRDLESGRVTKARAQELLECLFLKWNETCAFKLTTVSAGGNNNDKINLGGMDTYGRDATNELSYMLLEAHAHVHLNDPNLSVRVHRHSPDDFLRQTLEVVRLGGGLPILLSDEAVISNLISTCGVSLPDARNYGDMGCQENGTDPNMTGADSNGRTNAGWFNLPKPIELALWNGVNPMNGLQVGPQTGDPRTFTAMEQFVEAVKLQTEYAVKMNVIANNVNDYVFATRYPCVGHNLLHPGSRASGIDINAGGSKYNWTGALGVGMANAGDSLAAIDTLIYRTGEMTWDELLAALQNDWVGAEDLRRKCMAAPKYGCDDEYADAWTARMLAMFFDAYERHSTTRGSHFVGGLISMGTYVTMGWRTGATPDGRQRGERMADSTSPSVMAPTMGPTATHRSAARAIDTRRTPNGVTFNQRFNSTSIMSPRDLSKWVDLVRSYVESGGQQAQYTVVDRKALVRAQTHPDEYRDLIVRVGGYSAVFIDLSKEVQDSIIARAEQEI